ncbi:hypothetical protein TrST_g12666 [Triparma strigata]|uniref:Uncharacterized protein n=2 Tax=Triparma strigata TaxID=1606541 RepID=A0A9W7BW42_9STRA|nr:hypothetical protein TrST_g12666 [Triparma strigata]
MYLITSQGVIATLYPDLYTGSSDTFRSRRENLDGREKGSLSNESEVASLKAASGVPTMDLSPVPDCLALSPECAPASLLTIPLTTTCTEWKASIGCLENAGAVCTDAERDVIKSYESALCDGDDEGPMLEESGSASAEPKNSKLEVGEEDHLEGVPEESSLLRKSLIPTEDKISSYSASRRLDGAVTLSGTNQGTCYVTTEDCFGTGPPSGTSAYAPDERCTFTINGATDFSVTRFDVESGYDYLTVGGVQYDGTSGPSDGSFTAGQQITWFSDYMVHRPGFEICLAPSISHHFWDFRGCTTGAPVYESFQSVAATPMNGPTCSADGLSLDGNDDYVDITNFEFGGTTSIELYVKHDSFSSYSRVFDFGNGHPSDNVALINVGTTSTISWNVYQGVHNTYLATSNFDTSTWTHVVVTVSGTNMKIYKNGVLAGTKTDGHEPNVLTRTNHWLGRAAFASYGYFDGTIAYVKMWHGEELQQSDVTSLYSHHNTAHHFWDFRGCTSNQIDIVEGQPFVSNGKAVMKFRGEYWYLVRRVPHHLNRWHQATDNLRGTQAAYGSYNTDAVSGTDEFSLQFSSLTWDKMLVNTGDNSKWVELSRTLVDSFATLECNHCQMNFIMTSEGNTTPFQYMRQVQPEDPWISPSDHVTGPQLYGENSNTAWAVDSTGANVWVNSIDGPGDGATWTYYDDIIAGDLVATPKNGASCGADGLRLDGNNDYADIDDWEWGGTTSIEVYVKYDSFNDHSRVFDFSNGAGSDNVMLYNQGTISTVGWQVLLGSAYKGHATSNFDSSTWTHVVATVSGTNMKIYKNGVLAGTRTDGWEPNVLTRSQHWLGRSAYSHEGYFDGTIAYLKMWHGVELQQSDVTSLYAPHNTAHHFWDFRGCTTGAPVRDSTCSSSCESSSVWYFPMNQNTQYFDAESFTFSAEWTIETWVYPTDLSSSRFWLNFHSSENCILFRTSMFPNTNQWFHMVITYTGGSMTVYRDGVVTTDGIYSSYCGSPSGSLVFANDQDGNVVNDPSQASGHYQSTVAIYNQAKSAEEIQGTAASTEINALDPTLYALWADNTGTDLTGNGNTATLTSASVAGGPSEHSGWKQRLR